MNVFVLSTGRCGSLTISKAFAHASNFTSGHETEAGSFYPLVYPDRHIESDNRLAWLLGELDWRFPEARYIHLCRPRDEVAASFADRPDYAGSSLRGFAAGILGRGNGFNQSSRELSAGRYWDVINLNIRCFLRPLDEQRYRTVMLRELTVLLPDLWAWLGCAGDLKAAVAETNVRHNQGVGLVRPQTAPNRIA